jgi:hypothetical protein
MKQKRLFLVVTEKKRVRGRTSFYISEIINSNLNRLIDNDLTVSTNSNRGLVNEAVNHLIKLKELPENMVDSGGYMVKNDIFSVIHIESSGLAFVDFKNFI